MTETTRHKRRSASNMFSPLLLPAPIGSNDVDTLNPQDSLSFLEFHFPQIVTFT